MRILSTALALLLLLPSWTGDARLDLPDGRLRMTATPVALDPDDPARRRVGRLTYLGGVALNGTGEAFGGFSAVGVAGDRFTLVSDGGNVLTFRMGTDWRPRNLRYRALPAGPGTGWDKGDRDSEALARDPRTGDHWIAFERHNAIMRFTPDFSRVVSAREPRAMARFADNGGAESMAALRDGRVVTIAEEEWNDGGRTRKGLIFAGDPTRSRPPESFRYRPTRHFDPSDMAELPDGRVAVLERRLRPPFRFVTRVVIVPAGRIRPGATVRGRVAAVLDAPLVHDNFEGIAATREGGRTIIWLVSDDNQLRPLQRSLLLKFRLN